MTTLMNTLLAAITITKYNLVVASEITTRADIAHHITIILTRCENTIIT
jgi:hypothetical protein